MEETRSKQEGSNKKEKTYFNYTIKYKVLMLENFVTAASKSVFTSTIWTFYLQENRGKVCGAMNGKFYQWKITNASLVTHW